MSPYDLLGEEEDRRKECAQAEIDLRELQVKLLKSENAIKRLISLYADGGAVADEARRQAKQEEVRLTQYRQDLEVQQRLVNNLRTTLQDTQDRLEGLHQLLDRALGKEGSSEIRRRISADLRWIVQEIKSDPWEQSVLVVLSPSGHELRLSPMTGRFRLHDRTLAKHQQVVIPYADEQAVAFVPGDLIGGNIIVEKLKPGHHTIYELPKSEILGGQVFVHPPRFRPQGTPIRARTHGSKKEDSNGQDTTGDRSSGSSKTTTVSRIKKLPRKKASD
jgi:hypothetical protein